MSTQSVIDHFRKKTGVVLVRDATASDRDWDVLSTTASPDKYGTFTIYVVNNELDLSRSSLTSDTSLNPIKPDANGVFWDTLVRGTVTATKQFRANVFLISFGTKIGRTDATWDRLNAILRSIR